MSKGSGVGAAEGIAIVMAGIFGLIGIPFAYNELNALAPSAPDYTCKVLNVEYSAGGFGHDDITTVYCDDGRVVALSDIVRGFTLGCRYDIWAGEYPRMAQVGNCP